MASLHNAQSAQKSELLLNSLDWVDACTTTVGLLLYWFTYLSSIENYSIMPLSYGLHARSPHTRCISCTVIVFPSGHKGYCADFDFFPQIMTKIVVWLRKLIPDEFHQNIWEFLPLVSVELEFRPLCFLAEVPLDKMQGQAWACPVGMLSKSCCSEIRE